MKWILNHCWSVSPMGLHMRQLAAISTAFQNPFSSNFWMQLGYKPNYKWRHLINKLIWLKFPSKRVYTSASLYSPTRLQIIDRFIPLQDSQRRGAARTAFGPRGKRITCRAALCSSTSSERGSILSPTPSPPPPSSRPSSSSTRTSTDPSLMTYRIITHERVLNK